MTLQPHIDRHAILSAEKQFRLFDVIGERDWSADLEAGTISFAAPKRRLRRAEPPIEMGVALLGTESGGTWLWGWANPGGFAEPVVAAGRAVGDYGREHDVPPLYEPESAVDDDVTLDRIGIVASGVLGLKFVRDWPAAIGAYERDRGVDLSEVVELELDDLGRVTNLRSRLG